MKLRALIICLGFLFIGCFETTRVAEPDKDGTSSETIASVKGTFVDAGGKSVLGARVSLIPQKFNPMVDEVPKGLVVTTNSKGEYTFESIPKGAYSLVGKDFKNGTGFFITGKNLEKAVEFAPDTLRANGMLKVYLGSNPNLVTGGFIYISNLGLAAQITTKDLTQGFLQLDSLPSGIYPTLGYSMDTSLAKGKLLAQNLNVKPGQLTLIDNLAAWNYQSVLTINYGGIKLTENIYAYPVLVRLDSTNFKFNQAKAGLEDIRFSKPDGTPLSYEIESVDGLNKSATIWVSLDTVPHSQDSLQFKMYWGNEKAESRSDGREVFGKLAGYSATWHLNSTTSPSGLMSSFSNSASIDGQGFDSLVTVDKIGFSGLGHYFNGSDLIRIPNGRSFYSPKNGISMEVWFKATGTDLAGSDLVSVGNNFGLRVLRNGDVSVYAYTYSISEISSCIYNGPNTHALDNDWHQIVGTLKGDRLDLYEDGIYQGGANCKDGAPTFNGGLDLVFGSHGNGEPNFNFTGVMDEVRIFPGILLGKTIQLNFALQKSLGAQLKLQ